MSRPELAALLFALGLCVAPPAANAQGFGGPDAVENQLESDRRQVDAVFDLNFLDPYFAFKARLEEASGLSFGIDYTPLGLIATGSPGDDAAASAIARVFGSWELLGRNMPDSGALVFKAEHRHRFTDVPAGGFGFNTGYVGLIGAPFSDQGPRVTNLYWRQRLFDARATVTAGFLDTTDYVDPFALGSPWTHFTNFAFSTGSATIGLPDDATFGVAAGAFLTDNLYTIAGIADANGDSNDMFRGFQTFSGRNEYFTSAEIGWTSARERLIFDNIHATVWHTDGSRRLGVNNGWGVAASATWYLNDRWLPFVRGGYSHDGGALLQKSVSVGVGWQPRPGPGRDVFGIGLNWGQPNQTSFGPAAGDQFTAEVFYRLNLGQNLAVTPDVQVIVNPALDPTTHVLGIFGVRARLAL